MKKSITKTLSTTIFALFAFAGNSVLCRLALENQNIDATSFTIIRLISGAFALSFIVLVSQKFTKHKPLLYAAKGKTSWGKKWLSAGMLFTYAAGFSYAYSALDTGVGALVLFGTVQLTMISVSLYNKELLVWYKWLGLCIAFSGLCFLVYSQLDWSNAQVSLKGFSLMVIAGVAWAGYTLIGRGSLTPLVDTATSFLFSSILCISLFLAYYFSPALLSTQGVYLALSSGVLTSAFGYAIWYVALSGLTRVQAGVVQLLVPVIAALGGAIWVGESISSSLIIAQALVLSGIVMVMIDRRLKLNTQ